MHATGSLSLQGPLFNFFVAVSVPRQLALRAAGQTPPVPQIARLLMDTGASITALDGRIISALGLTPTGSCPLHTPSTGNDPVTVNLYDVELAIAGHAAAGTHSLPSMPIMGADFAAQGIDGLAGRDLLSRGRFIYSGIDGYMMLSL